LYTEPKNKTESH